MSRDVRSAVSRSASIFILYLTTCANSIATEQKRKTLSPQDIIEAVNQIGFTHFTQQLQDLLQSLQKTKEVKAKEKQTNKVKDNEEVEEEDEEEDEDEESDEEKEDEEEDEEEEDEEESND